MQVRTNLESRRVILSGVDGNGSYEIQLRWHEAANLATILNQASRDIEPVLNFGKKYSPACER
jgi:hypothetical protein